MHVLLLALCAILVAVHGNESPQMIQAQKTFTKCALMDEANDYRLYWNLNATHVVFGLRAQVTGWIALGQSQSGHMNSGGAPKYSDITIGWVDGNGKANVGDYFVDRYQKPTLDDVSNVYDASGFEVADGDKTVSFITFTRELAASDTVQDLSIDPNQPAFFIWAANVQVDPISFDQFPRHDIRGPFPPGSMPITLSTWTSNCPSETPTTSNTSRVNVTAILAALAKNKGMEMYTKYKYMYKVLTRYRSPCNATRPLSTVSNVGKDFSITHRTGKVYVQTGASSEIVVKTANEDHEVTGEGTLDIEVTLSKQSPALKMGASAVLRIFLLVLMLCTKNFKLALGIGLVSASLPFCVAASETDCVVVTVPQNSALCTISVTDIEGTKTLSLCNRIEVRVEESGQEASALQTSFAQMLQNIVKDNAFAVDNVQLKGKYWVLALDTPNEQNVVDLVEHASNSEDALVASGAKFIDISGLEPFPVSQCNAETRCNGRGSCSSRDLPCECDSGYKGDNCELKCPGKTWDPCSGKGVCSVSPDNSSAVCTCQNGYGGENCGIECPGGEGNVCSNHGTCLAENATCVCDEDYAGSDCSAYCPNCTVVEITMPKNSPQIENGTSYKCHNAFFTLRGATAKHIVRTEVVIDNAAMAHHCVVLRRRGGVLDTIFGKPDNDPADFYYDCLNMPSDDTILLPLAGWGIGSTSVSSRPDVGQYFGISEDNDTVAVIVQMHYDNPGNLQGQYDASGIRIFLTDELREFNGGALPVSFNSALGQQGVLRIPPRSKWEYTNYCPPQNLQVMYAWKTMLETAESKTGVPITFLNHNGHMHQIGSVWRSMKQVCKHSGNYSECADESLWHNVTELGSADPYDYNDQKTVPIPGNVTLGSEERIMTYFQWDAKDRDTWTFNGPGAIDEMGSVVFGFFPDLTQFVCSKGQIDLLGKEPWLGLFCGAYCHDPSIDYAPYYGWREEYQAVGGGCKPEVAAICPECTDGAGELTYPSLICVDGGLFTPLTGPPMVFPPNEILS